jgi:hypothetical protein
VTVSGDSVTLESHGPSAKFSGRIVSVDAKSFDLDGTLEVIDIPIGYSPMTMCDEKSPLRFRNTGKRKFFRHTRTCQDMTTTYFDIFTETVDASKIELTKKMSALQGKHAYDRPGKCVPVLGLMVDDAEDPICVRWNESGLGAPYYDCKRAAGRLYVFDKPKACKEIADRLNNP